MAGTMHIVTLSFLAYCLFSSGVAHSPIYQTKLQECPVHFSEVDYTTQGREIMLGNLSIYETADTAPKRLIISVIDIFGITDNTRMVSDLLAEAYGFRVVTPDFFRGVPWPHSRWPLSQEDYTDYRAWHANVANYEEIVRYDIKSILEHYKTENITEVGVVGFCWGAKIAALASAEFASVKATGLVHPSLLTTELIQNAQAPMYLFPAFDDPDMLSYYVILKQKFGDNCGHRRYNDMCHGFATAMGNFSNPLLFQRVEQTIDIIGNFFLRNMSSK